MSYLQNKSNIFNDAAKLLHEKCWYPAVAHGAYYSCYQLSKHIWLHKMKKTQRELDILCSSTNRGSHEVLYNEIRNHIKNSNRTDCYNHMRNYYNKIVQLKKLRVKADYDDENFDISASNNSILLSDNIIAILKKYQ